ncbi:hypothetical protein LTR28_007862, partial [Elasticomyces elasticus]
IYVERQAEVCEIHVWGLKDGVKIAVEGFVDEGKTIKCFHTFSRAERVMVKGSAKTTGFLDVVSDLMSNNSSNKNIGRPEKATGPAPLEQSEIEQALDGVDRRNYGHDGTTDTQHNGSSGGDVIFRPSTRIVLPTNDINIDFERRNKAAYGLTMVTSVAHVWFNTFFEAQEPEKGSRAERSGVFEIEWDAMDGIKGSAKKGIRAFDKIAVVWKAIEMPGRTEVVVTEPKEGEEVKQTQPADWRGEGHASLVSTARDLGLRAETATSATVSRASSVGRHATDRRSPTHADDETAGVRAHGPLGEDEVRAPSGPLPTSRDLPGPTHPFASEPEMQVHSPDSREGLDSVPGLVRGMQNVHTADLPDGKPEEEMNTPTGHSFGHVKLDKNVSTSS